MMFELMTRPIVHAIAAAQVGLAVAEDIVGKADARTDVIAVVRLVGSLRDSAAARCPALPPVLISGFSGMYSYSYRTPSERVRRGDTRQSSVTNPA